MGITRDKLLRLINSNDLNPSLTYWCNILNFSEEYKNSLNIQDMEIICAESERIRAFYNTDRKYIKTIPRNGSLVEIEEIRFSLNIGKEEVSPNVYQMLEEKQRETERLLIQAREETRVYIGEPTPQLAF